MVLKRILMQVIVLLSVAWGIWDILWFKMDFGDILFYIYEETLEFWWECIKFTYHFV